MGFNSGLKGLTEKLLRLWHDGAGWLSFEVTRLLAYGVVSIGKKLSTPPSRGLRSPVLSNKTMYSVRIEGRSCSETPVNNSAVDMRSYSQRLGSPEG